jgi:uncharacterized protein
MTQQGRQIASYFLVALVLVSPNLFAASGSQQRQDEQAWRTQRATNLQAPDGWFSLVGLDWLQTGKTSVGTAPDNRIPLKGAAAPHVGIFILEDKKVQLFPPAGGFPAGLTINGKPAQSGTVDEDRPLKIGTFTLVAIQRGDRFALRIKDSQAPTRLQFHGLNWYAPDDKYRLQAKWIPYSPPHDVQIPTVIGTTTKDQVPGVAEFTIGGQVVRLEPIVDNGGLFFILRDETSKSATYGAGRFLYAELPDHGLRHAGAVELNFNRLQNPPCAYTPYATCPLPPPQNRLSVPIPAGEKRYHAE